VKYLILLLLFSNLSQADDLSFAQALNDMVKGNIDVQVQQTKFVLGRGSDMGGAWRILAATFSAGATANAGGSGINSSGTSVASSVQVYSLNTTWNIFRSGADLASLRAATMDRNYQQSLLETITCSRRTDRPKPC